MASEDHRSDFMSVLGLDQKEIINVGTKGVTGCIFMPDGELVVCDWHGTHTVKVLTRDFKLKQEIKLDSKPWDVATLSQDKVIVTQPESKILQVLKVSDTLEKGNSFPVDEKCWGVDCKNGMIYVSCHIQTGTGGTIKVLSLSGEILSSIRVFRGDPFYLAVNSAGDRITVCTDRAKLLLCTDTTGKVLYEYKDAEMNGSGGITVDSDDNVMVCGTLSKNIHVVKKDGTKHRIILTRDDGMDYPHCLAYRASEGILVVGQRSETKSLLAFKVKK